MKWIFFTAIFFTSLALFGQTATLKGVVTIQNSGKKPLPQASVTSFGANPTTTNSDGSFKLVFANKSPGMKVSLKLQKEGFDVVNEKDLSTLLNADEDSKLKLWVAPAGELDKRKMEFYNINEKIVYQSFRNRIEILEKEKKATNDTLQKLEENYRKQLGRLEELSEQFAVINLDDVSDLYKNAYLLFEKGNIDSAINLLEQANLLDRADKRIQEKKRLESVKNQLIKQEQENEEGIQEDMKNISLQAEMYVLKFQYDKAIPLYEKLILLDTLNYENIIKVADFYKYIKHYDRATQLFLYVYYLPPKNYRINATCILKVGNIKYETGKFHDAIEAFKISEYLFNYLTKSEPENELNFNDLAISYLDIGNAFRELGMLDSSIIYLMKGTRILENLNLKSENSIPVKLNLASAYTSLGQSYRVKGDTNMADMFVLSTVMILEDVYQTRPGNRLILERLALAYPELSKFHEKRGEMQNAMSYLVKSINTLHQIYKKNPQNEDTKNYLALNYADLGDLYNKQNKQDSSLKYHLISNQLFEELYVQNTKRIVLKQGLATSCERLGQLYLNMGDAERAQLSFSRMHALMEELYSENPDNINIAVGLAFSFDKMGTFFEKQKNFKEAEFYYIKFNEFISQIYQSNTGNQYIASFHSYSFSKLGILYLTYNKLNESLEYLLKNNQFEKLLFENDKDNVIRLKNYGISFHYLALNYKLINKEAESAQMAKNARELISKCYEITKMDEYLQLLTNIKNELENIKIK